MKLPPSSAARRVACPGSRALEEKYPREDTSHADEGRLAHAVAQAALTGEILKDPCITKEMEAGAKLYQQAIMDSYSVEVPSLHLGERIEITSIHSELSGEPDCFWFSDEELHIFEYKFGHSFVDVFDNYQMLEYAAGIIDKYDLKKPLNIYFYIVQPRCFIAQPVRKWVIGYDQAQRYFEKLRDAEAMASLPMAPCYPNPECNFCSARHVCSALARSTLTAIDACDINTPFDLTSEDTGNELRVLHHYADLLKARITGLEAQAVSMIKRGERVLGYRLENSRGSQIWTIPPESVAIIGELLDTDLKKPLNVVTPKQAIDLGIPKDLVNQNSKIQKGEIKLNKDKSEDIFKKTN